TLCPRCREAYEADAAALNRVTASHLNGSLTLHRGRGCKDCHESGYSGRTGIFEMFEIDETLRSLILQSSSDAVIRQAAIEAGMRSMGEDGLKKVMAGHTTLEEITRVVYLAEQAGRLCPSCQTYLTQEFDYCTTCGEYVGEHCERCHKRMSPDWK